MGAIEDIGGARMADGKRKLVVAVAGLALATGLAGGGDD